MAERTLVQAVNDALREGAELLSEEAVGKLTAEQRSTKEQLLEVVRRHHDRE